MSTELPPFSTAFTSGFSKLLFELKSSLAISTYQAGKLVFISPKNEQELVVLPRSFSKPMGIAIHGNRLAVATRDSVFVYRHPTGNAHGYPKRPNRYDALYLPRSVHFTGELDIHDLSFANNELLAVNTRFSCVARIDGEYSFTEVWKPWFITELAPEDRCHLNGVVHDNGKVLYATALGQTNISKGWRPGKTNGGILIDAQEQRSIVSNLSMPHSPRLYNEGLFVLLSGTGELIRVEPASNSYEVIHSFDGFVRGLDRIGDFLFIGLSKLRTTSAAFGDLPIASKSPFCGIVAFHLPSRKVVGSVKFETSIEEIFDVRILQGQARPGILSIDKNEHDGIIAVKDGIYWPMPAKEE